LAVTGAGMGVAVRDVLRACLLVLALSAVACGPTLSPRTAARLDMAAASRTARLAALSETLRGSLPEGMRVSVVLSRRDGLGAWAHRRGRIEVTPALVDLLDDDELAAAVAHELGHLVLGQQRRGEAAALAGSTSERREHEADAVGCRLLAASGRPPDALPRMLRRLSAAMKGCDFSVRADAAAAGPCAAP
jgi:Zn-dependent protease with chaperone function